MADRIDEDALSMAQCMLAAQMDLTFTQAAP